LGEIKVSDIKIVCMMPSSALLFIKANKDKRELCNNTWLRNRIFKLNLTYFVAYSKKATGYREIKSPKLILINCILN